MKYNFFKSFARWSLVTLLLLFALLFAGCNQMENPPAETLSDEVKLLLADVGLEPDGNDIYTLAEDHMERATQLQCIYSDEVYPYIQSTTFRIKGETSCKKYVNDPTTYIVIYARNAEGEDIFIFDSTVDAVFADGKQDKQILASIMDAAGEGVFVTTGTFGTLKVEGRDDQECRMFFAESIEPVVTDD